MLDKLTLNQVNYLNICLILLSWLAAFFYPFELFLFSYTVLGPLHYLTEIVWLKKSNFFLKDAYTQWGLFLLVILLTACVRLPSFNPAIAAALIFFAFVASAVQLYVKSNLIKIALITATLSVAYSLRETALYLTFFAIFFNTLVHVFIFTAVFMLYGTLKKPNLSGWLCLLGLALASASFFIFKGKFYGYNVGMETLKTYWYFAVVNTGILEFFLGKNNVTWETIAYSEIGLAVMRFIAFAYTYHYLNWFSKTSVIKWHEINKVSAAMITLIWAIAVRLYQHDYRTGIIVLLFMSNLHVFLEFPLNWQSTIGVVKETKNYLYNLARYLLQIAPQ